MGRKGIRTSQHLSVRARIGDGQPGSTADQHRRGKETLGQHRAITDETRIRFTLDLFGGRSTRYKAVKARDSAAGDGDEQEGHPGWCALWRQIEGGCYHGRRRDENTEHDQGHGDHQLPCVDKVTRLKKSGHTQRRGDIRVDEKQDRPHTRGRDSGDLRHGHGVGVAEHDRAIHGRHSEGRDQGQIHLAGLNRSTHDDGDRDL